MQVQCSYRCNGGGISKTISHNYNQLSSFCFVLLCKSKYSCRSKVSCFRVYGFSLIDSMHYGIFTTPKWFMNNLLFLLGSLV